MILAYLRNLIRKTTSYFIVIVLISLCSCREIDRVEYSEFADINPSEWFREECIRFTPTLSKMHHHESNDRFNMELSLRHNDRVKVNKIWFAIEYTSLSDGIISDTIGIDLCDWKGKWLGKGNRGLYDLHIPLQHNMYLPDGFHMTITHAMSNDTLSGIENIGIILYNLDK